MEPRLAGIETEYGLAVAGRGAAEQVQDSGEVVRHFPGAVFEGWDYRQESPRADLRGFELERLQADPVDAQFDRDAPAVDPGNVRSDRVLPNGARFYSDHGHPEYATPECWSLRELMLHDLAGDAVALAAARRYQEATGRAVRVYKNNTDYHGASYGTHESYLAPRALGFEALYAAVTPMLIARQVLCGAGKAGSENGAWCDFQLSQRADFLTEAANAETLYRRPVFNTRDEPHADPRLWIRLHVIAGDANRIPSCTARKVGLVRLAIRLAEAREAPAFRVPNPAREFQRVSRDATLAYRIELERGWTGAGQVIESYLAAAEARLELDDEETALIAECRRLLDDLRADPDAFRRHVDWAAKRHMLAQYVEAEGCSWRDPAIQSLDLEYHNLDPDESLFAALVELGEVEPLPEAGGHQSAVSEPTRAYARGRAVARFPDALAGVSWSSLTFRTANGLREVYLDPCRCYGKELDAAGSVDEFVRLLEDPNP
jgi:proteasome accessory factor A